MPGQGVVTPFICQICFWTQCSARARTICLLSLNLFATASSSIGAPYFSFTSSNRQMISPQQVSGPATPWTARNTRLRIAQRTSDSAALMDAEPDVLKENFAENEIASFPTSPSDGLGCAEFSKLQTSFSIPTSNELLFLIFILFAGLPSRYAIGCVVNVFAERC